MWLQRTVWGPRGCSGAPKGDQGIAVGLREIPRRVQEYPKKKEEGGPRGMGVPLGSPGVLGIPLSWRSPRTWQWVPQGLEWFQGVLSHPAPWCRGRRGCEGAAGPGVAPGRAAPAAPKTAQGGFPRSHSPTSPRGLQKREEKTLSKGVVQCTSYLVPPKRATHPPPTPLHPVGKQEQNFSRKGFGVSSPTP